MGGVVLCCQDVPLGTWSGTDPPPGDVMGGFQLTTWIGVIAAPNIFGLTFVEGNPLPLVQAAPVEAWFTVLYLGLVMTVIGYSAWYYAARYRCYGHAGVAVAAGIDDPRCGHLSGRTP